MLRLALQPSRSSPLQVLSLAVPPRTHRRRCLALLTERRLLAISPTASMRCCGRRYLTLPRTTTVVAASSFHMRTTRVPWARIPTPASRHPPRPALRPLLEVVGLLWLMRHRRGCANCLWVTTAACLVPAACSRLMSHLEISCWESQRMSMLLRVRFRCPGECSSRLRFWLHSVMAAHETDPRLSRPLTLQLRSMQCGMLLFKDAVSILDC